MKAIFSIGILFLTACAQSPYALRDMGSFHVGGPGAGGKVDVVDLSKAGIKGNSHMLMMDRNNGEVAALIQSWLEKQGLLK